MCWTKRLTAIPGVFSTAQRLISRDYKLFREIFAAERFFRPGASYLDVGCGPGTFYGILGAGSIDYLGIDISREYIAEADRLYPGRFRRLDARELKAIGRRFDGLFSIGLFHHLNDRQVSQVLENLPHVLADGGKYLIIEAIPPLSRWNAIGWLLRRLDAGDHIRPFEECRRLFSRHAVVENAYTASQYPLDYGVFVLSASARTASG